jgi:RimJ/RimL family protein N-acetyltransferase
MFTYAFEELNADAYETQCRCQNTNSAKSILSYGFQQVSREDDTIHFRLTRSRYQSIANKSLERTRLRRATQL